jgi:hypothetical protein
VKTFFHHHADALIGQKLTGGAAHSFQHHLTEKKYLQNKT